MSLLSSILLLLLVPGCFIAYWMLMGATKRRQREKVENYQFPSQWNTILEKNVPICARIPGEQLKRLKKCILVFLEEKVFEGCNGQEINDEVRVTIAAQACLLLLNGRSDFFPGVSTILVYPSSFLREDTASHGTVNEGERTLVGEAWKGDYVVLAWDHALSGSINARDAYNPVLHEFAHQLDVADGWFDGTPPLPKGMQYSAWSSVLAEEFNALSEVYESGKTQKEVLDEYATTNKAEFFAVATEAFFEKPQKLKEKQPKLYQQLQLYYALDPTEWSDAELP